MESLNSLIKEIEKKEYSFKFKNIENTVEYLEKEIEELRKELKNKKLHLKISPINILCFVTSVLIKDPPLLEIWDIMEFIYDIKYAKMSENFEDKMNDGFFRKISDLNYSINKENVIYSYDYLWFQEDIILNYYKYERIEKKDFFKKFINLI